MTNPLVWIEMECGCIMYVMVAAATKEVIKSFACCAKHEGEGCTPVGKTIKLVKEL